MNIRNRIFKIEPNADSGTVRLMLLRQDYEFDPHGRKDGRGRCLDYRIVMRWETLMPETTAQDAQKEARGSWRLYPPSTKALVPYALPTSVRCLTTPEERRQLRVAALA